MKKIFISGLIFGVLSGGLPLDAGAALQFREIKASSGLPDLPEPPVPNYMGALRNASVLHNVLNKLPSYREESIKKKEAEERLEKRRETLKQAQACNIRRLEDYFKDPAAVWRKIIDTYHRKEKELSIYLTSARPADKQKNTAEAEMTDEQIMAESFMYWKLGDDILTDVYANQDNWGERKTPESASFPIWEDQKYIYDQAWDEKYTKINAFFGVPPTARPLIKDEAKHDYARHEEVVTAHTLYLGALSAANPQKALLLPNELKQPPEAAPRPLPPKRESVIYREAADGSVQVYPEWPAPWQDFANSGFTSYNPSGEMAQDFIGKSLSLKESAKGKQPTNRLDTYQRLEQRIDTSEQNIEARSEIIENIRSVLAEQLKPYDIDVSETDLGDEEQYERLKKEIEATKKYYIRQAQTGLKIAEERRSPLAKAVLERQKQYEERKAAGMLREDPSDKNPLNITREESYALYEDMQEAPQRERAQALLNALTTDTEAKVSLSRVNAANVDQLIKEADALAALTKEMNKLQKQQKEIEEPQLDDDCLDNGGIY